MTLDHIQPAPVLVNSFIGNSYVHCFMYCLFDDLPIERQRQLDVQRVYDPQSIFCSSIGKACQPLSRGEVQIKDVTALC